MAHANSLQESNEPLNVGLMLTSVEEMVRATALRPDVVLRITPIKGQLHADREAITRAMMALIGNALSVSPPGATVSVDAQPLDTTVLFWVRDEGPGIEAERVATVFEEVPALGIARELVEANGGLLWAESMPPLGTTFVMQVPRAD